ncbi:MAG: type II secretion system F family protein [archaeon]
MSAKKINFEELKKSIDKEAQIVKEISALYSHTKRKGGDKRIDLQIDTLTNALRTNNKKSSIILKNIFLTKPYPYQKQNMHLGKKAEVKKEQQNQKKGKLEISPEDFNLKEIEKSTLKRLRGKEGKEIKIKEKKPSLYVRLANKTFSEISSELMEKNNFKDMQKDLVKANLGFLLKSYISIILFTTLISFFAAVIIFLFFLFFNVGVELPIVTLMKENLLIRFLKTFWILFAVPLGIFGFMYIYPSLEKSSVEKNINKEIPFATIHMAAISGSMINPTKIFEIIISTKEYPNLNKEFIKLMNGINVFGNNLVVALRNSAANTASKKLVDLYNGLATTISSGGDLPKFFDEKADSLLFEYNLEKEKNTKSAETFMDIYISVVIAAPMILMLLLIMMRISGLGIPLSPSMITLVVVLGVSVINVIFLVFLQIKQGGST